MGFIDFILNLAGLLLWLGWRTSGFDPLRTATPSTLAGTLKRAGRPTLKRWQFPSLLAALLFLRGFFYWQIGVIFGWSASLGLGSVSVSFRGDSFTRMLLFSVLSFGVALAIFYLWLLFLSIIQSSDMETDPVQKQVRMHLGRMERWPLWTKFLAPLFVGTVLWWLFSWPLVRWGMIPSPVSGVHRIEQALVIGLGCYLAWKYLFVGVLALHMASSYVFFGNHPFWRYTTAVSRRLLSPLEWIPLRIGKVDFAPMLGIVLVFVLGRFAEQGLQWLFVRLPF